MSGPPDRTLRDSSASPQRPKNGTAPAPARPDRQVAPPPVRVSSPAPVTASFWLWVASFLIGLLVVAYSLSQFDALRDRLENTVRQQQPGIESELLSRVVDLTLYIGLGGITALILVQLVLAVLMRAGRGWARALLVLTAVLCSVAALLSLVTVAELARPALALQGLAILAATVLMFLPSANSWFRRRA